MTRSRLTRLGWTLGWFGLVALSGYYLYRALNYRFLTPNRLGPGLFNKQIWYFTHLITALPVLAGAPLQFIPSLRARRPALHRLIGRFVPAGVARRVPTPASNCRATPGDNVVATTSPSLTIAVRVRDSCVSWRT